jgi:acyl-coenzyme A synthetase/AMP-(fatty) acid ligase
VAFLAALPRTETGKLQRFRLRQAEPQPSAASPGTGIRGAGAR